MKRFLRKTLREQYLARIRVQLQRLDAEQEKIEKNRKRLGLPRPDSQISSLYGEHSWGKHDLVEIKPKRKKKRK